MGPSSLSAAMLAVARLALLAVFAEVASAQVNVNSAQDHSGQTLPQTVAPLVQNSCLPCHDATTDTDLNFEQLGYDLSDQQTYQNWLAVYDRVRSGEMPPEPESRPDPQTRHVALQGLADHLRMASRAKQEQTGRVPSRRLTKLELGYTLRDLLHIDRNVTTAIPEESSSGTFDTVGIDQRMSAVHMESYLEASDKALAAAIQVGRNQKIAIELDFAGSKFLNEFHDKPLELGGSVSRRTEHGVALFRDVDYLLTSHAGGAILPAAGQYRISTTAKSYQSTEPITLKIIRKETSGAAQLLITKDLIPGQQEEVSLETFLKPGDTFYTTFAMKSEPFPKIAAVGVRQYNGPGIEVIKQNLVGPLTDSWPPKSTQELFAGCDIQGPDTGPFQISITEAWISERIRSFCKTAFRRPVIESEIQTYLNLVNHDSQRNRPPLDRLRLALKSILAAPQFLLFSDQSGELDDHALATRLSYFLWKSLPDATLTRLANLGQLSEPDVLKNQVDRMLADPKSQRFIKDFVGQWLRLYHVNATSPDEGLYPEFDELLGSAIPQETECFVTHLIQNNLSILNLVDSDFTFVNRRLAQHYDLPDVDGQEFRRVKLPAGSKRGGILTQAAILKTTANGTTTSPVMRGNFVLTTLLGTPPPPPPPAVGSIEPDTRGQTTIREILQAHREIESCNQCHQKIDPPGFALESFDPIGGYRSHYRATGGGLMGLLTQQTYHAGPAVDPSGVTADGQAFNGISDFKKYLLNQDQQIARNLISLLVVYSTGGEIEFVDHDEIDSMLEQSIRTNFGFKDMIHAVVQSHLFRHL